MTARYYSCKQIAGAPGMPLTPRGVHHRATKLGWPSRARSGAGGGREYLETSLPIEAQNYLRGATHGRLVARNKSVARTAVKAGWWQRIGAWIERAPWVAL